MKIAHLVESYYPSTGGMQEVVKQLSENLTSNNKVVVYTSYNPARKQRRINGVKIKQYKISGNLVGGIVGNEDKFIADLLRSNFDIITLFAAQQWTTDLVLKNIDKFKKTKTKIIFVPTGFSALYNPSYIEYFKKMEKWFVETDANIFLSNNYRDINFARKHKAKNIVVIPNGASKKEFFQDNNNNIRKQLNINQKTKILFHVGSHSGQKGHRELIKIFNKLKSKNITLVIQGNGNTPCLIECKVRAFFASLMGKDIRITDMCREDTVKLYKESNLFVFPSNIECSPVVLFEAAASKLPFVCTNVGNSREIIKWLRSGELIPTHIDKNGYSHANIEQSSYQIDQLLNNKSKLKKYSETGYQKWLENYTWEKISQQYESLYKKILSK